MTTLDETGHAEVATPLCHWCDKPLDSTSSNGLHQGCIEEYNAEVEQAYDRYATGWVGTGREYDPHYKRSDNLTDEQREQIAEHEAARAQ